MTFKHLIKRIPAERLHARSTKLLQILSFGLWLCLCPAPAYADDNAQTIVHMLDYISVDYPEFVKDGKVLDETEFKEQLEFAAQAAVLLAKLNAIPEQAALLAHAEQLKKRITSRAEGKEVSASASALRWKIIEAYNLSVAPRATPDPKHGAALYVVHCAGCHGTDGRGDGIAAKGLDPAPSNFHDANRMAQRSIYGLYSSITLGVPGTAMKAFSHLGEDDRWALALHVATLGPAPERVGAGGRLWQTGVGKDTVGTLRAVTTLTDNEVKEKYGADTSAVFSWLKSNPQALSGNKEQPITYARRLLGESLSAYRSGRTFEAQQLALTSYLEGFELVENSLDTLDRTLRQSVESEMIAYRNLLRNGAPLESVTRQAGRVDDLLAASAEKLGITGLSPATAGISAFFILTREGLEALLVVTAIIAFLAKSGRREAMPWIHAGWIGALLMGAVTWFAASSLIAISGATREMTEGVTALFAAVILIYIGLWMHGKVTPMRGRHSLTSTSVPHCAVAPCGRSPGCHSSRSTAKRSKPFCSTRRCGNRPERMHRPQSSSDSCLAPHHLALWRGPSCVTASGCPSDPFSRSARY